MATSTSPTYDVDDRWERCAPGNFIARHSACVDSTGNLYVAEGTWTFGVRPGLVPLDCGGHQVQKFIRR